MCIDKSMEQHHSSLEATSFIVSTNSVAGRGRHQKADKAMELLPKKKKKDKAHHSSLEATPFIVSTSSVAGRERERERGAVSFLFDCSLSKETRLRA